MSTLTNLKAAVDLDDVAAILGFQPSALAYLLYVLPAPSKYSTFTIPKKSGGMRTIQAPDPRLKTLQRRLANVLYACSAEISKAKQKPSLSHGFKKEHSIVTNAWGHTGRRFVVNFDIEDYFPSFNFGRVRGFFMSNDDFRLNASVATVIAQIAIHNNELPQGSPCSPVIADLITHALDVRLAQLAKKCRCMYSRYADDITFSTNQKSLPTSIAAQTAGSAWTLSNDITRVVARAGFAINVGKTRVQTAPNRQVVTGLTVNRKVNVHAHYYRNVRSMCNSLFRSGEYHLPRVGPITASSTLVTALPPPVTSLLPLEGMLNFVCSVKSHTDYRDATEKRGDPTSVNLLYRKFLNFKYFIAPDKPLIFCEGKTDNVYLRCAIRQIPACRAKFLSPLAGSLVSNVKFFNYTDITQNVMLLGGGSADMVRLIQHYREMVQRYMYRPMAHPVILVIDNDSGAAGIFKIIRNLFGVTISHTSSMDFYHLCLNLYLVKTPEIGPSGISYIEDFFSKSVTNTLLDGKAFDPNKAHGDETKYGKHIFADQVISRNAASIDFTGFERILERISLAIDHYALAPKSV